MDCRIDYVVQKDQEPQDIFRRVLSHFNSENGPLRFPHGLILTSTCKSVMESSLGHFQLYSQCVGTLWNKSGGSWSFYDWSIHLGWSKWPWERLFLSSLWWQCMDWGGHKSDGGWLLLLLTKKSPRSDWKVTPLTHFTLFRSRSNSPASRQSHSWIPNPTPLFFLGRLAFSRVLIWG